MDQHLKNVLAIIIAFASAMTFIVVLVRLKSRAAGTERLRPLSGSAVSQAVTR
jgi:hypothetical protein